MPTFPRHVLFVAAVLLIPIFPFLLLGEAFEERVAQWSRRHLAGETADVGVKFGVVTGLLAADLFLPIPSSAVSTYAGGVMPLASAAAASWLGMTAGACLGFGLARGLGRPFAARRAGQDDLERMHGLAERYGPLTLVLTRPLPLLAEACVLLLGTTRLSWRRFLAPVLVSNLVISLTYTVCGRAFAGQSGFWPAVILSGTIPLLAALWFRSRLPISPGRRVARLDRRQFPVERPGASDPA